MKKILADSSVWIDALHSRKSKEVEAFKWALEESIVCVCPPILQEVLQGIKKDSDYKSFLSYILEFEQLKADTYEASIGAVEIYRGLRVKGITIRKSVDCLIAWYALKFDLELLHNDRDFDNIAKVYTLKLLY
jgi:predicted nucleic acid-binding protein